GAGRHGDRDHDTPLPACARARADCGGTASGDRRAGCRTRCRSGCRAGRGTALGRDHAAGIPAGAVRHVMARHTRRDFLSTASAATLSALAAGYPRVAQAKGQASGASGTGAPATADAVIVLWMAGGMAHTETFDPKRYTPFSPGLKPEQVLSTFPAIDTAVDGITFSAGLEHLAKVIDRGTLIRTYRAGDLGFILHSRHQFHWHTGYAP